jgi:hypothetical protein
MVLYAIAYRRPVWFWLALLWHALVDAVAVYTGRQVGILAAEGFVAVSAVVSISMVLYLRSQFVQGEPTVSMQSVEPVP